LRAIWIDRGTPAGGWDGAVTRFEVTGAMVPAELSLAIEMVGHCTAPAAAHIVLQEIARLLSATVSAKDGVDLAMAGQAIGDELLAFPADIVIATCRELARRSRFLPTVNEVVSCARGEFARRSALRRALERAFQATSREAARLAARRSPPPSGGRDAGA
jgi:hypothetical protein